LLWRYRTGAVKGAGVLKAGPKGNDAGQGPIPPGLTALEFCAWWGGKPYAWQAPLIEELCADTRPRLGYIQVGRKNGKSFLAACIAIDEMVRKGGQVFLIADSERNLKSALYSELVRQCQQSPQLAGCVLIYKDHLECPQSGGRIELRPNNLGASQSINGDLVLFDEVHMQKRREIWDGMSYVGAASKRFLLLGITTPGYEVVSLAHDLYMEVQAGETWGKIYEATDKSCALDDEAALRQANPVFDEDPDHWRAVYAHERKAVQENDYRRFRLGQWTAVATRWLPQGAWAARTAPAEYRLEERLWVGFDGSYSGDSSALVACNSQGHIKVLGLWENPGRKDWRVPRHEVAAAVADVMDHYDAILHVDPPYWGSEIAEWDQRWPGRVIECPTNSGIRMAHWCSEFEARLLEGAITHDGHRALEEHMSHATVKMTSHGVVITKPTEWSPLKIDAAVACVLAVAHAAITPAVEPVFVM